MSQAAIEEAHFYDEDDYFVFATMKVEAPL